MLKKLSILITSVTFLVILYACKSKTSTTITTSNEMTTTRETTTTTKETPNVVLRECKSVTQTLKNTPIASQEIIAKAEAKLAQLSLAEKAGQMVQAERNQITPEEVKQYNVGSILSGGGSYPSGNTPQSWVNMYNTFQTAALQSSSGIPIIYGVDAVHGHGNVQGATIFPHNIGLGAANNSDLMYEIAKATSEEIKATGLDWNFAPAVSVVQDIRWGRTYESFGECPDLQVSLVEQYIKGLQDNGIAATAKHFIGDGGTEWNANNYRNSDWAFKNPYAFMMDQGNVTISMEQLRKIHLPGYIEAINAGVDTIMVSYSSYHGKKMHSHELIETLLKGELGFQGIVISDYDGIQQLPGSYHEQVITAVNAGIDMLMEPSRWKDAINAIIDGFNNGKISEERINDAVKRILIVKYKLGLFDEPIKTLNTDNFNSEAHKELARTAARESLVLLKNEGSILPLKKSTNILLLGPGADNVALQNGGWTIEWQGTMDKTKAKGTSILQGIKQIGTGNVYTDIKDSAKADVVVVVIAERPYAEGIGDNRLLSLNSPTSLSENITALNQAKNTGLPMVVILLSGRPMIVTSEINYWDSFIAAWLPGSEGGRGIADVLFGDYDFTGKLPVTWPEYSSQAGQTINKENYNIKDYLFPYGYGLSYNLE